MSSTLDWLDSVVISIERSLANFWNYLVLEEQRHPIILALALIIVLSVLLTFLCNCFCWFCGLCRPKPRQPGLIYVPANYGSMMYPPVVGPQKPPQPNQPPEPQPSTSHNQEITKALVHV